MTATGERVVERGLRAGKRWLVRSQVALLALTSTALAQPLRRAASAACATPAASASVAEQFGAFQCAFDAGDYAASLVLLERACERHDSAVCAFNLGLVHNTLYAHGAESEHCALALDHYRHYLSSDPYGDAREEAQLAASELEQRCEPDTRRSREAAPAPLAPGQTALTGASPTGVIAALPARDVLPAEAPPASAAEPEVRSLEPVPARAVSPVAPDTAAPAPSRVLPLALLGAGAASGAAALIALGSAWRAHGDLERRARSSGDPERQLITDREAYHLSDSRDRGQALTWVFGLGSVLLLGAGTTLLMLESEGSSLSAGCGGLPGLTYATGF